MWKKALEKRDIIVFCAPNDKKVDTEKQQYLSWDINPQLLLEIL